MNETWRNHPAPEYDRRNILASKNATALLVIDMQEHFRDSAADIIENVQNVIKTCNELEMPVFYTQHGHKDLEKDGGMLAKWWSDNIRYGSKSWQLLPEIKPLIKDKNNIIDEKTRYDAFIRTPLKQKLDEKAISTILICGTITNLCCETTARSAFNQDYNVIVLGDGCGSMDDISHEGSLRNLSIGFARVVSCDQVIKQLRLSSSSS
jgi:nicotinamidase-related amidase